MKTYFKFACIYCGQHMECKERFCGCQILCPTCSHRIVIPRLPGVGAPRQPAPHPVDWADWVPTPKVEVPTRYRNRRASSPVLA